MSVNLYSRKHFTFFTASQEISFCRLMHAHMLQRVSETSFETDPCNFFHGRLIRQLGRLLSRCGIRLIGFSLLIPSGSFKGIIFTADTSNMEFTSTNRYSKSVWILGTSHSYTYFSAWWLSQILISVSFLLFALLLVPIKVVCALNSFNSDDSFMVLIIILMLYFSFYMIIFWLLHFTKKGPKKHHFLLQKLFIFFIQTYC